MMLIDYCCGGDMFFHLSKLKLGMNEDATRFYVSQIILVLGYLHSNKII